MSAHKDTQGFWVGRLSACIGENATRAKDAPVREDLRETLREFIASPVPSEELRVILRRYVK